MNYLVYWFGETFSIANEKNCFSVLSQDSDSFVPWEQAKKQHLHVIPHHQSSSHRAKKKIAALRAIHTAARQSMAQISEGLPRIQEFHELLCCEDLAHYDRGVDKNTKSSDTNARRPTRITTVTPQRRSRSRTLDLNAITPLRSKRRKVTARSNINDVSNQEEEVQLARAGGTSTSNGKTRRVLRTTKARRTIKVTRPLGSQSVALTKEERSAVPVSPVQDNDDDDDDDDDRKPMARITVSETGASAIDSYCGHVQEIQSRNTALWSENERLELNAKMCRAKYEDLSSAVDSMFVDLDHSEAGSQAASLSSGHRGNGQAGQQIEHIEIQAPLDTGDNRYLENMCIYLGKIAKQNADLEQENSRLEREVTRWNAKFNKLDVQVRRLRNLRQELN